MLRRSKAFSSFSVNDLKKAKQFYGDILGLNVEEQTKPGCGTQLRLKLEGGGEVLIYEKKDHNPASFTVLNFPVGKIEDAVKNLKSKGITLEHFEGNDEQEINRSGGPLISWFKDPAGNYLSVLEAAIQITDEMNLSRFFAAPIEEVFEYWTKPDLIQQWAAPEGMTLKVSLMEARPQGKYVFEHTAKEGRFVCTGHFEEYIPEEKLVQIDTVKGPDEEVLFENLKCTVSFRKKAGGTQVDITQNGFPNEESLIDCEKSWNECFDKLSSQLNRGRVPDQMNAKDAIEKSFS